MTALWLNSPSERLVAAHLADSHPAWLWQADSEALLWRNRAARAYEAANRRQTGDVLVPVSRQIARAVRLGVPLRASLARLQFALGRKPLSETCACTPVLVGANVSALLVVLAESIPDERLTETDFDADALAPFTSTAQHFVLVGDNDAVLFAGGAGKARLLAHQAPAEEFSAGAAPSRLILFPDEEPRTEPEAEPVAAEPFGAMPAPPDEPASDTAAMPEVAFARIDEEAPAEPPPDEIRPDAPPDVSESEVDVAPLQEQETSDGLLNLLDRLASHGVLYQPLDEDDDLPFAPAPAPEPISPAEAAAAPAAESFEDNPLPAELEATGPAAEPPAETIPVTPTLWRVTGRNLCRDGQTDLETAMIEPALLPAEAPATDFAAPPQAEADTGEKTGLAPGDAIASDEAATLTPPLAEDVVVLDDVEAIERASRYNFDELSRILTGRVFGEADSRRGESEPAEIATRRSLISLGDETLILNRLPLGLMVFRDQKILFSNRALADLLGYDNGASLRAAGLGGVFPSDGDNSNVGPVTRLTGADGRTISVTARLQAISWQGKPALLLSASRQKEPLNAEDLARGFAESMSNALEFGYFETSRAGILTKVSARTAALVRRSPDSLVGRPIHGLIALNQGARLRGFLEQPARFAGSERPALRFTGVEPDSEVILFAEGMAGIVTGYFGLMRRTGKETRPGPTRNVEPAFLARLGRAMRQPVTAIVGFAEIIRDQSFGPVGNDRYVDYARFIRAAGHDIAGVVDEIESFARLGDSETMAPARRIELIDLLETCVARVRSYAVSMRVLVRSGISASLPPISADPDTLTQAVLNLLASAVAHSPSGGQVVLSAQARPDGSVAIHIRDSANADGTELEERFVVFRDGLSVDGEMLAPLPSAIGLTLTRTLLAVNSCLLEVDPGPGTGMILSLIVPAGLVIGADSAQK